jgi:hypothetical protein
MNSLQRRITKLERISPPTMPVADLSQFTRPELKVLRKLMVHTLTEEERYPTGKRPLPLIADTSGLSAEDMAIYRKIAERAECR